MEVDLRCPELVKRVRPLRSSPAGWCAGLDVPGAPPVDSRLPEMKHTLQQNGSMATWRHFAHDADIGLIGVGPTKAEAFQQAAIALTAVVADPALVKLVTPVEIACHAPDDELLLVEWLNALIYEMSVRSMLFGSFSVTLAGGDLRATAWGEPVDPERHEPAVEIKGATMTELCVTRIPAGWLAQCVVDV
jgi:tRNA nucleotidyltransferase (CCA-adding enzyme)